jgi:CheY-like chemotaxis protein
MESVPDDEREVAIGKADIPKGKKAASAFGGKKLDLPKHIRMLVVDDMEMNRKVVIRKLSTLKPFKELEWSFTQAKNGEEALKVLEDEGLDKFDVVWMDEILSLTGGIMLGSETIRIIRGREERKRGRKRSVVVSSTGNTTEKDCALYLDAGADFVAAKPTPGAEELAELFRAAFRKRGYN